MSDAGTNREVPAVFSPPPAVVNHLSSVFLLSSRLNAVFAIFLPFFFTFFQKIEE